MLRNGGNDLPILIQRQNSRLNQPQKIIAQRRTLSIDMSSFNDDTTLEEIEELMEEDNEQNDDVENTSTVETTASDDDDDGSDAILDEIFDELTDAFANVTNTTSEELFDTMMDTFFGPSDGNGNSTSASKMVDTVEEVMTSIFGVDNDDVPPVNATLQGDREKHVESPIPVETQEVVITTNVTNKDTPPLTPNVTASNMNDAKEIHAGDNDTPEPPTLLTTSPTTAPHGLPTSLPSESPTFRRFDDFDPSEKETEMEDDDVFAETTFHSKKNRPVGNGIPNNNNKFSFTIVLGVLAAIIGMIFTAWQMADNPDGIYAALCRLTLTCIQLAFRIIMSPCRKCCGGHWSHHHHHLAGTNGYHEPYGHLPVSTMDYGYKDPALELT
jgi:hypothetical protein